MPLRRLLAVTLVAVSALAWSAPAAADSRAARFDALVDSIFAEPYQPAYVPQGYDSAFAPEQQVLNTFPAEDYTSGSRQGSPDAAAWPSAFRRVTLTSSDGAPLPGYVATHFGKHPGVVVVHGFNSNGKDSVVRWAAMLYASGYNVAAIDQRGFPPIYRENHPDWARWPQTLGWKEADDVLAAGRYLKSLPGVTTVGVMGFSLGGQNTVLALARDARDPDGRVFAAGLNFSGPANQNTQIYSTAFPPGCQTPFCTYPVTAALIQIVIPPFTHNDPCTYLSGTAAPAYGADPYTILAGASAYRAQGHVKVPLVNVYAADDPLVASFQARMMAGYNVDEPLQRTLALERGAHAYFYDRWWQQRATLLYFKALLPGAASDATVTTTPTVNRTDGGAPAREQLADVGSPTRADADALTGPYICDTSRPGPGGG